MEKLAKLLAVFGINEVDESFWKQEHRSLSIMQGRLFYHAILVDHLIANEPNIAQPKLSQYESFFMSKEFRRSITERFHLEEIFPKVDKDGHLFHFLFLLCLSEKEYSFRKEIISIFEAEKEIDRKSFVIQFGEIMGLEEGQQWVKFRYSWQSETKPGEVSKAKPSGAKPSDERKSEIEQDETKIWTCDIIRLAKVNLPSILGSFSSPDKRIATRVAAREAYHLINEQFPPEVVYQHRQRKWFSDEKLIAQVTEKFNVKYLLVKRQRENYSLCGVTKEDKIVVLKRYSEQSERSEQSEWSEQSKWNEKLKEILQ
jgi:hypothetical protein